MNHFKRILSLLLVLVSALVGAQPLTIQSTDASNYSIAIDPTIKKYKLTWNAKPDSWTNAQSLKISKSPESFMLASVHPIIRLESKKEVFFAAPRGIKLKGAANFRDLGGYKTTTGKQVKWGKIYRSADISKLTDEDLKTLQELNIKMVCDLRGEQEVATAPDKLPVGTDRILLSAGSENVGAGASYLKYLKSPAAADSMLMAMYTRTDHLGKKYKPMFDQLLVLENDKSLMFHCTAGKDRTGVGAALILYALGVDESTIIQDYSLTNEFRKESNEQFVKMLASQGLSEQAARNLMAAKEEYIKAAFDSIKKQYGSIDNLLEREMGLDAQKRTELKSKFLY